MSSKAVQEGLPTENVFPGKILSAKLGEIEKRLVGNDTGRQCPSGKVLTTCNNFSTLQFSGSSYYKPSGC